MLLCIDIGSTNIKFGLFNGAEMCCHWRIATDRSKLADEYAMLILNLIETNGLKVDHIEGCAISSVVPTLTPIFTEMAARYLNCQPRILLPETQTDIRIRTDYPTEVGADLVVNAIAARHLYGTPVIAISFGTATTFVAVSADGDLEGVAIAPGMTTSGDSLFRATSTLPQVALSRPPNAIGKNTVNSLQSGFVFGFAGLVERLVVEIRAELGGNARVVATGGLANLVQPETQVIEVIEQNLALIGLRLWYEGNNRAK